ncbi:MAG: hypothetical protein JWO10_1736 [Microbacteriaceae bacterium]|nr:hypothetical protein [Microbacteriaceae bacterium]
MDLDERLASVTSRIEDAVREAGRDPDELTTVVVTKFHPASLVRELHQLGIRDFGESRHQEAQQKSIELAGLDLRWHFVGQLQSKKARQAAEYASVIHSLDRESVVDSLGASAAALQGFVQLNLTDDPGRGGVSQEGLEPLVERILGSGNLELLGVMAVAPVGEEPRAAFARVLAASERVRAMAPTARFISAGMSGDFREAIMEGATHLRIGSAITGNRPAAG